MSLDKDLSGMFFAPGMWLCSNSSRSRTSTNIGEVSPSLDRW
jgi:hypothetical protein